MQVWAPIRTSSKFTQHSAMCHLPAGLYRDVGVFVLWNISGEDEQLRRQPYTSLILRFVVTNTSPSCAAAHSVPVQIY